MSDCICMASDCVLMHLTDFRKSHTLFNASSNTKLPGNVRIPVNIKLKQQHRSREAVELHSKPLSSLTSLVMMKTDFVEDTAVECHKV